jgi:hypothetical protein
MPLKPPLQKLIVELDTRHAVESTSNSRINKERRRGQVAARRFRAPRATSWRVVYQNGGKEARK